MKDAGYRTIRTPSGKGSKIVVKWDSDEHRDALAVAYSVPARIQAGHFEPVQAASCEWAPWDPGLEVVRAGGGLVDARRFDATEGPGDA